MASLTPPRPPGRKLPLKRAALLIIGRDPDIEPELSLDDFKQMPELPRVLSVLSTGLKKGLIRGTIVYREPVHEVDSAVINEIDEAKSTILLDSLDMFVSTWEYFNGQSLSGPLATERPLQDYMDPQHGRYAPKLAAAVKAWIAVGEKSKNSPRTPKQLLEEWLLKHAAEFGLQDKRGNPNKQGIGEVTKVANWKLKGGAPKSPANRRGT
ncbi:MAG TPA: hypothetical protein VM144_18685 [Aestuariivirga sp.]|nr:hypothetical protein [Aestuariivirga sp.]